MNNIEKKLDALIDALGFDVECDLDKQSYDQATALRQAAGASIPVSMSDHYKYKFTKRQDDEQRKNNLYIAAVNEYNAGASTLEEFAAMVIASELTR